MAEAPAVLRVEPTALAGITVDGAEARVAFTPYRGVSGTLSATAAGERKLRGRTGIMNHKLSRRHFIAGAVAGATYLPSGEWMSDRIVIAP